MNLGGQNSVVRIEKRKWPKPRKEKKLGGGADDGEHQGIGSRRALTACAPSG